MTVQNSTSRRVQRQNLAFPHYFNSTLKYLERMDVNVSQHKTPIISTQTINQKKSYVKQMHLFKVKKKSVKTLFSDPSLFGNLMFGLSGLNLRACWEESKT